MLPRLEPLTNATAIYSDGLDLCVRTASGDIYCDTRSPSGVPTIRDTHRRALARYRRPTPFAPIAWSSEPGPWMLPIFNEGPLAPLARRLAGADNTPWTLAQDGLVRQVRTIHAGTRTLPRVTHATALETHENSLCALTAQGEAWCWSESDRWPPVVQRVNGLRGAHDLVVLDSMAFAVVNGALLGWDLPSPEHPTATLNARDVLFGSDRISRLVGGCWRDCHLCAIETDDTVTCGTSVPPFGMNIDWVLTSIRGARDLASHGDGACALMPDGHVRCWSHEASFALSGAVRERERFAAVVGLPPARQIAVSATHACAATLDGHVYCWGANESEQVAAERSDRPTPTAAPIINVAQVGVGEGFSCALSVIGDLVCWGEHGITAPAPSTDRFSTLAVSRSAVCVRRERGIVRCLSPNHLSGPVSLIDTQLGALTEVTPMGDGFCAFDARHAVVCWTLSPDNHAVATHPAVSDLVALIAHSSGDDCGVRHDGMILCWHDGAPRENDALQRPADVTQTVSNRTMFAMRRSDGRVRFLGRDNDVSELAGVTQLALADGLVCALHEDGSVSCAGANDRGQLGDGSPSPDTPADVVIARETR